MILFDSLLYAIAYCISVQSKSKKMKAPFSLFFHQLDAEFDAERVVDPQQLDRHATYGRATHQVRPRPPEMPRPLVPTRVEQGRELPRIRREAADVRSIKRITIEATQA